MHIPWVSQRSKHLLVHWYTTICAAQRRNHWYSRHVYFILSYAIHTYNIWPSPNDVIWPHTYILNTALHINTIICNNFRFINNDKCVISLGIHLKLLTNSIISWIWQNDNVQLYREFHFFNFNSNYCNHDIICINKSHVGLWMKITIILPSNLKIFMDFSNLLQIKYWRKMRS